MGEEGRKGLFGALLGRKAAFHVKQSSFNGFFGCLGCCFGRETWRGEVERQRGGGEKEEARERAGFF